MLRCCSPPKRHYNAVFEAALAVSGRDWCWLASISRRHRPIVLTHAPAKHDNMLFSKFYAYTVARETAGEDGCSIYVFVMMIARQRLTLP